MTMSFLRRYAALALGPLLFVCTLLFFRPEGLSPQGVAVLAVTFWIALWWMTEAIPISVTALLPIVLFPLTSSLDLKTTAASYGHKYIFLYLGGFILAIAIERWNLHKRIAIVIISLVGASINRIFLGFMLATAFMSMWISNTATSVMMLPIALAIVTQLGSNTQISATEKTYFAKGLMLAIAYSASVGGIASLIGTPTNLVFAGVVDEIYGVNIGFFQWFKFGFPVACILLAISWIYLTRIAFPLKLRQFPGGANEIKRLRNDLGRMSYEEKVVLTVFVCTAILWVLRAYLQRFIPALDDSIIAIVAAISLFALPAHRGTERARILNWDEAVKLPWGVILLFGGGISIAAAFQSSGLALWIGGRLTLLENLPIFLLLLVLIAMVNFLTEITSNLATTAMLLPILAGLALTIDVHPFVIMVGATVAASCAFMLPVATPPNAVVFGSGYLSIKDMMKTGIWMNLISIILLTLAVLNLFPLLWGLEIKGFPVSLR